VRRCPADTSDTPDQSGPAEAPHYHGHRMRLRERFHGAGADALSDYELLEMVLFSAGARRNNRLGVDPVDWTAKVPFADVDAVVAEDGVGHGDVEIDVLDDHLQ
jgi:hypothetical protein